jgi:hypothetical protein
VQWQDVGVGQLGGNFDLSEEALGAQVGSQLRVENLYCDESIVLEVAGQIHSRHAASAELALDGVAVGERGLQLSGEGIGHGKQR